jgi:hypothetical protein
LMAEACDKAVAGGCTDVVVGDDTGGRVVVDAVVGTECLERRTTATTMITMSAAAPRIHGTALRDVEARVGAGAGADGDWNPPAAMVSPHTGQKRAPGRRACPLEHIRSTRAPHAPQNSFDSSRTGWPLGQTLISTTRIVSRLVVRPSRLSHLRRRHSRANVSHDSRIDLVATSGTKHLLHDSLGSTRGTEPLRRHCWLGDWTWIDAHLRRGSGRRRNGSAEEVQAVDQRSQDGD